MKFILIEEIFREFIANFNFANYKKYKEALYEYLSIL